MLARMSEAESSAAVDGRFDAEQMGAALVDQLPRTVALEIISPFQVFQDAIKRRLAEFAERCPGVVVTRDIMKQIAELAKQDAQDAVRKSKRQRLAGNEALPE